MLKVGEEVSNIFLLYAVSGYVIFPIVLSFITLLIILKFFPNFVKRDKDPQIPSYFLWIVITIYGGIFGVMAILRYLSFHNGVLDFGVFDHAVWSIAKEGNFRYLAFGHFSPVLIVYALFYKLYSSGIVLLIAQTVAIGLSALPLYYMARGKLGNSYYASLIVVIYFLYSPVQYNNLFDFHTDHLIILIMFLGFYFLEKRNALAFVLICLAGLTIKEPLILSMAAMGLYAISHHRMYKSGSLVLVGSLLFFFWVVSVILPQTTGTSYGGGFGGSFSYLGSDVFEIGRILLSQPWIILKEMMNVWKMGYLVFIFFPLLLIPLLSPLSLIPAIPALAISLLSRLPNYYWIQHHYTASVIAPVFISLIYGVSFLGDRSHYLNRWFKKFFSVNLSRNSVLKISLWTILVVSLYYNVVLSPSPISIFFWKKMDSRYYHRTSYAAEERDRVLDEAIKKFIPQQASVTSQNPVNSGYLAHRTEYYLFPGKVGEVDYVVLDRKKPRCVWDRLDKNGYEKEFKRVLETYKIVFSYDEMYIFKKI